MSTTCDHRHRPMHHAFLDSENKPYDFGKRKQTNHTTIAVRSVARHRSVLSRASPLMGTGKTAARDRTTDSQVGTGVQAVIAVRLYSCTTVQMMMLLWRACQVLRERRMTRPVPRPARKPSVCCAAALAVARCGPRASSNHAARARSPGAAAAHFFYNKQTIYW